MEAEIPEEFLAMALKKARPSLLGGGKSLFMDDAKKFYQCLEQILQAGSLTNVIIFDLKLTRFKVNRRFIIINAELFIIYCKTKFARHEPLIMGVDGITPEFAQVFVSSTS